jgi:hypothetical protein
MLAHATLPVTIPMAVHMPYARPSPVAYTDATVVAARSCAAAAAMAARNP